MDGSYRGVLDQVCFTYGPRDLLAGYFLHAERIMQEIGIRLRICHDFRRLIELNNEHRKSWPTLLPIFNPAYNRLTSGDSFWIEGIDAAGETVLTSAGRLCNCADRSLAGDLRSLRIFYADPPRYRALGAAVDVQSPSAEHITGRCMFSGAVWVRPDYRRHGFTRIVPRLTRSYALTAWNPETFWMLIEPELDRGGVTRAYGSWHIDGEVLLRLPDWRGSVEALFGAMRPATLLRDLASSLDQAVAGTSRWSEIAIANISPPLPRQGSNTRS